MSDVLVGQAFHTQREVMRMQSEEPKLLRERAFAKETIKTSIAVKKIKDTREPLSQGKSGGGQDVTFTKA